MFPSHRAPFPFISILVTDDDSCDPGNFTIHFLSFALSLSILVSRTQGFCGPIAVVKTKADELMSLSGLMENKC